MEMRPMTAADPKMAGRGEIHMCSDGIPWGHGCGAMVTDIKYVCEK